ncbi:MAG: hypothetical protein CALGDGBN_01463 [Pseudomonadales bacterium]|nr:hypothetical protein [Pseudomonadales bacterium]
MVSNEIPALTPDELLTTTRTIRKRMDFERPVSRDVIEECLTLAMQAPNGSNMQSWEWLLIDDADMRCKVADIYRAAMADHIRELQEHPENYPKTDYSDEAGQRMFAAVAYLNENLHRAPVLVIPTFGGRTETASVFLQASMWGSILPAVWNFMLALRSRGMGSAWTTIHLNREREMADLLGIPFANRTQAGLFPVAYTLGTSFKPGRRRPVQEVVHWNRWQGR